jgi:undecaprenyl-diphosphatase
MNYFDAAIYGIIQGLAEFLPVSSSGHLALLPHLLTINDPGVAFDLAMHLGTALAIIIYFHKDITLLLMSSWSLIFNRNKECSYQRKAFYMLVATASTGIVAIAIKSFAESYGRNSVFIAINLLVFGLIMWVADSKCKEASEEIFSKSGQWKKAFFIGLFQSIALFPGVSRSGITLTTARFLGISREEGSRFSFLLSLPLIIGGAILKLPELTSDTATFSVSTCLFGVFVSFVVGFLTIHYFLKFIKRIGLAPFATYRFALAITILLIL